MQVSKWHVFDEFHCGREIFLRFPEIRRSHPRRSRRPESAVELIARAPRKVPRDTTGAWPARLDSRRTVAARENAARSAASRPQAPQILQLCLAVRLS